MKYMQNEYRSRGAAQLTGFGWSRRFLEASPRVPPGNAKLHPVPFLLLPGKRGASSAPSGTQG